LDVVTASPIFYAVKETAETKLLISSLRGRCPAGQRGAVEERGVAL
jgi:hypothetical protein